MSCWLFRSIFNFLTLVRFLKFFLLITYSSIPPQLEKLCDMISVFFIVLWFVQAKLQSLLENVYVIYVRRMCICCYWVDVLYVLGLFGLKCRTSPMFCCWFSVWMICPLLSPAIIMLQPSFLLTLINIALQSQVIYHCSLNESSLWVYVCTWLGDSKIYVEI